MTSRVEFACLTCARFQGVDFLTSEGKCTAFGLMPIPQDIISGKNDHTKPFAGDNGLTYFSRDDALESLRRGEDLESVLLKPHPSSKRPR